MINKKVIYSAIAVFVVLILGSFFIVDSIISSLSKSKESIFNELKERNLTISTALSALSEETTANIYNSLLFISEIEGVISSDPKKCSNELKKAIEIINLPIVNILRTNAKGAFYCSAIDSKIGVEGLGHDYINNISSDEGHGGVLSRQVLFEENGGKRVAMVIHIPVFEEKIFVGTLGGVIYVDEFIEYLKKDFSFPNGSWLVVLDDNGDTLYHPNNNLLGSNIFSEAMRSLLSKNEDLINLLNNAIKIDGFSSVYYTVEGTENLGVVRHTNFFDDRHWSVLVTTPVEYISQTSVFSEKEINKAVLIIIFLLAFTIFAISLAALFWNKSLVRDIKEKTFSLTENIKIIKDSEKKLKELVVNLETSKANLESKKIELEKINKLMIDREIRMVELKKKIKDLEDNKNI